MSGIFKRLSRLARAEINNLGSRLRSRDEINAIDDEWVEESVPTEPTIEPSAWPREIREAYAALELPLGSDEKAIKKAYRSLLNRYHPDKHHGSPEKLQTANELTMRLRDSYERLMAFWKQRKSDTVLS